MQLEIIYDFIEKNVFQDRYHNKTPLEVRIEALTSDIAKEYPIPENNESII